MTPDSPLLRQLQALTLREVAITAALDEQGGLHRVGGVDVKMLAALAEAQLGRLRIALVAADQDEVDAGPLPGSLVPLHVIKACSLVDAVTQLHARQAPHAAIVRQVLDATARLELLDGSTPLLPDDPEQRLFQPLPLLRELDDSEARKLDQQPGLAAEAIHAWEEENLGQAHRYDREQGVSLETLFDQPLEPPRLVILAPPGRGKSTLIQYAARLAAQGQLRWRGRSLLPARVPLALWCRRALLALENDLASCLADLAPAATRQQWQDSLEQGEVLLLLDGLDEAHDPRGAFLDVVLRPALKRFARCPVLLTCRTVAFEFHLYRRLRGDALGVYLLRELSPEQVRAYGQVYRRVCLPGLGSAQAERFDRQLAALLGQPSVAPLATNPLLLSVLCFVLGRQPQRHGALVTRCLLFNEAVNALLQRPRPTLAGSPDSDCLPGLAERRTVLEEMALHLFERQGNQEKLLQFDETQLHDALRAAVRSGASDHSVDALRRDLVQCGLLHQFQRSASEPPLFFFLHLQIQEYLAACALARRPHWASAVLSRLGQTRWREGLLMTLGQLRVLFPRDDDLARRLRLLLEQPDPLSEVLPRAALLLTVGLTDLGRLPDTIVQEVVERLLVLASDPDRIQRFPALRRRIEQALRQLSRGNEAACVSHLLHGSLLADRRQALAAAGLVGSLEVVSPELIQALASLSPLDESALGWPIDTTLRHLAARPAVGSFLDEVLPLRALLQSEQSQQTLGQDPGWLRVLLALLGGLDGLLPGRVRAKERRRNQLWAEEAAWRSRPPSVERRENLRRLQAERERIEADLRGLRSTGHHFDPRRLHRPSPLTSLLEQGLRQGWSSSELLPRLWEIVDHRQPVHDLPLIDAVLALAVLGERIDPVLQDDPQLGHSLREHLTRLESQLRLAIPAALAPILSALRRHPGSGWLDTLQAVLRTALAFDPEPTQVVELIQLAPDEATRVRVLADYWHRMLTGTSDDPVYNLAVILDTLGGVLARTPRRLALSLALAHTSMNCRRGSPLAWQLDHLAPRVDHKGDLAILAAALDALAAIPQPFDFVRGWALGELSPLLRAEGLHAEAALLASSLSSRFGIRADTLKRLGPPVSDLLPPLARFRFQLRLLQQAGTGPVSVDLVRAIEDPALRADAFERLASWCPPGEAKQCLEWALEAARSIPLEDRDNRARALLRLAGHFPDRLETDCRGLLESDPRNLAPLEWAGTLATLRDHCWEQPALRPLFLQAIEKLPPGPPRFQAAGEAAPFLRHQEESLGPPESLAVFSLGAIVLDLGRKLAPPGSGQPWPRREQGHEMILTRERAQELDAILRKDPREARRQLSLLRSAERPAWPVLRSWLTHPDEQLSQHAALLLAEAEGFSAHNLPLLFRLLQSSDDRLRFRAALVLHGDRIEASPVLRVSQLRPETVEILIRQLHEWRVTSPPLALTVSWALERIVHDDGAALERWARQATQTGQDGEQARLLLGHLSHIDDAAWPAFCKAMREGQAPGQRSLLRSLTMLLARKRVSPDQWEQVHAVLRDVSPSVVESERYLADGALTVVQAALDVLAGLQGSEQPRFAHEWGARAQRHLEARASRLADLLRSTDPAALREGLAAVGRTQITGQHLDQHQAGALRQVEEHPELLGVLVPWLTDALRQPQDRAAGGQYLRLRGELLGVVASAAERLPGVFLEAAQGQPALADRLGDAVRRHDSFPGRQAALRVLAALRRATPAATQALVACLEDVVLVQQTAFETLARYQDVESRLIEALLGLLRDPQARGTHRYGALRMLTAVARNVFLSSEQRQGITSGLRDALLQGLLGQEVYLLTEQLALDQQSTCRIELAGRLDQLTFEALLELSGVAAPPDLTTGDDDP